MVSRDNFPIPFASKELPPSSHKARKSRPMFILLSAAPHPPILDVGTHQGLVAVLQAHSHSEETQAAAIAPLCSPHCEGLQPSTLPSSSTKPFRCLDAPCSIVLTPKDTYTEDFSSPMLKNMTTGGEPARIGALLPSLMS